ncbi:small ribosomal subunit protein eS12 [Chironomus tepperi]|jgi:small subunit ribosomal protein S12e|uniref:small ribosomal subunit protein eS12 n=1 Tax=Chironomus tepperi TaxID=113505 RepID=UPI00391F83AE
MSDTEVEVAQPSVSLDGAMDLNTALQEVLKQSLICDGLVHGIHQSCKVLDKRQAVLCILSESCDEPQYKQLITALCNEHQIPLLRVDSSKKLGEWSGLCKIDKEGKPRKICGCSCVVIKNYGQETPALDIVKQHLRSSA